MRFYASGRLVTRFRCPPWAAADALTSSSGRGCSYAIKAAPRVYSLATQCLA